MTPTVEDMPRSEPGRWPIHADGIRLVEHGAVVFVIFTDSLAEHTGQAVASVLMSKTDLAEALSGLGVTRNA